MQNIKMISISFKSASRVNIKPFLVFVCLVVIGSCSSTALVEHNEPLAIAEKRNQYEVAPNAMVATSHSLATEAGLRMLKEGGNAMDATVAAAFAVGVVEPMMAGIGGGGSLTVWMKATEEARHFEFYASAGADSGNVGPATPDSLLSPEQEVAVPGTVAGLLEAHQQFGKLSRAKVMRPAIRIAEGGFTVHPLLAQAISSNEDKLHRDSAAADIFYPDGEPLRAGEQLVQPELAFALKQIALKGKEGFYEGIIARNIVSRLERGDSPITLKDFKNFSPRLRNPLLGDFRGYTILAPPPPMAGMEIIETLNLLESYDLSSMGYPVDDPEVLNIMTDAIRIARADRYKWNGDPDGVGVPAAAISSKAYADKRRSWIGNSVPDSMAAGDPWGEVKSGQSVSSGTIEGYPYTSFERPDTKQRGQKTDDSSNNQTTHMSIIDEDGNAVTLTFTMGQYFGSGVFSNGAFYNTAARNFDDAFINYWGPNRTPRSSTAPTMVLEGSDVRLVVGSPASGRIPPAIVQMILYTLEYKMDPLDAIYMPRIYPFTSSRTLLVEDGFSTDGLEMLTKRGYEIEMHTPYDRYFGGVHMVFVTEDGRLVGVADPRRNGTVSGM